MVASEADDECWRRLRLRDVLSPSRNDGDCQVIELVATHGDLGTAGNESIWRCECLLLCGDADDRYGRVEVDNGANDRADDDDIDDRMS